MTVENKKMPDPFVHKRVVVIDGQHKDLQGFVRSAQGPKARVELETMGNKPVNIEKTKIKILTKLTKKEADQVQKFFAKEAARKARAGAISTCRPCRPDTLLDTLQGDRICQECGLVTGPALDQMKPGLEKDEDGNLVRRGPDFQKFEELTVSEKFQDKLGEDAEKLARAFMFPPDTKGAVNDVRELIKRQPALRLNNRARMMVLGARLLVQYKLADGRQFSKVKTSLLRQIKADVGARGAKADAQFEMAIKKAEKLPSMLELAKDIAARESKSKARSSSMASSSAASSSKAQQRPVVVNKVQAQAKLRAILMTMSIENVEKMAQQLGIRVNVVKGKHSKEGLVNKIMVIKMRDFGKKAPTFSKNKFMKFESCEDRLKRVFNKDGRAGIEEIARDIEITHPGVVRKFSLGAVKAAEQDKAGEKVKIKDIKKKTIDELIRLICLADLANNMTAQSQRKAQAAQSFVLLNDPSGKVPDEADASTKKKLHKELVEKVKKLETRRAIKLMKEINVRHKSQQNKRRRMIMVDVDPDTGDLTPVPNQTFGVEGPKAVPRATMPRIPGRVPQFQPTNTKQANVKMDLVAKAKEELAKLSPETSTKPEPKLKEPMKLRPEQRKILRKKRNIDPDKHELRITATDRGPKPRSRKVTVAQIMSHPMWTTIEGRSKLKTRREKLEAIQKLGVTLEELRSIM